MHGPLRAHSVVAGAEPLPLEDAACTCIQLCLNGDAFSAVGPRLSTASLFKLAWMCVPNGHALDAVTVFSALKDPRMAALYALKVMEVSPGVAHSQEFTVAASLVCAQSALYACQHSDQALLVWALSVAS